MQLIIGPTRHQLFQLGNERGDAYATSNQNVALTVFREAKQILRLGDLNVIAHVQCFVHVYRAAFAFHIFAHANFVSRQISRRTHQRIGIGEFVAHLHDDVAAACKRRKGAAIGFLKRELLD